MYERPVEIQLHRNPDGGPNSAGVNANSMHGDTRSFSTHLARRLELRAAKLRAEAEKKANQERELAARLHLLAARLRKEEETHTEAAPPH